MNILPLKESNDYLISLLKRDKPFMVTRLGIGGETYTTYHYDKMGEFTTRFLGMLENNAGIYGVNTLNGALFCRLYLDAIENSDALACFTGAISEIQQHFTKKFNLQAIHSRILEPFYCFTEFSPSIKPWTHYLLGKRVLIVNPFIDSMQLQLRNGFQIFKDPEKKIFLDGQEFVFYKSYQTAAGNKVHANWLQTFNKMCEDIKNMEFDVALLGCGGYGLPLCNFIRTKLNKSAIYIGGGLQLLFGVMGKRWENIDMWKQIIAENDTQFIRPSADETIENNHQVEGGCYW